MAWQFNGNSNLELINNLRGRRLIFSEIVKSAMFAVDRRNYSPANPYMDAPQSIGYGGTINSPQMHAYLLELLKNYLSNGERALDIGCGSGYLTACMALILGDEGFVVGIDHIPELVELAKENIEKDQPNLIRTNRVQLKEGDGRLGYPELGPYKAIHVGTASPELPQALLDQLKPGGRMIIPIGPPEGDQYLKQFDKLEDGTIQSKSLLRVIYIPLTD